MLKSDELSYPQSCINKAAPDEPVFVLRAKDPLAAQTVRLWAAMAFNRHEPEKVREAHELAASMDDWQGRQPKVETNAQTVNKSPLMNSVGLGRGY